MTHAGTPNLFSDDQTHVVNTVFAVIYAPGGRNRKRFPEGVVEVCESEADALAKADAERHCHAAQVTGPSRSSEGFRLYYLVRWLTP
jgi:hypothetical protein